MAVEPEVVWMPDGACTEIHLTGLQTGGAALDAAVRHGWEFIRGAGA